MRLAAVVVLVTTAAVSTQARAQEPAPLRLLDVPYLPQTVALCGGAAAAMVMRFWGATGVYAETFADLVIADAGGIRGDDLLRALQARGWDARSFRGDPAFLQSHLAARRPVVALIEDRPGRFHYVVIVGWSNGRVIAHDPARAPFRVFEAEAFQAAWEKSGFWTLLALPGGTADIGAERAVRERPAPVAAPVAEPAPCQAMVDEGVRLAGGGEAAEARRLLALAADACPDASAPWREIAGVDAIQGRWKDAAENARRALTRDAADRHARRILATSLYLESDHDGALAAWNALGEPVIDLVEIRGLDRTRYDVVTRAMGLEPQTLLTPDALRTARERLAQVPAAQVASVSYRPGEGGAAQVHAVVLERPLVPTSPLALAAAGVRLVTDREVAVAVSSPTGGGELWKASWRWWKGRPRTALEFSTPAPFGGVWGVRGVVERESYRLQDDRAPVTVERRRSAALTVSHWRGRGLRLDAAGGFDSWSAGSRAASLSAGLHQRLPGDTAFVEAELGAWVGSVRTWTAAGRAEWRSSRDHEAQVVIVRGGLELAGGAAPLSLWAGAGTGQGRDILLRAHPLLDGGVLDGRVFGRTLAHAGAEWRRWTPAKVKPLRVAPAVFVDVARAWRGGTRLDERWHMDVGGGLRVHVPGAGVVRVDLARGLRDGRTALSVGWTR